jgi:hypothetical protein
VTGKKVLNDDSIIHCAMNIQRRMQEAHLQVYPHPESFWLHFSRPPDCPLVLRAPNDLKSSVNTIQFYRHHHTNTVTLFYRQNFIS